MALKASLQTHYTVLQSSFLLPFPCTSWCCCSLPCISQILQVQIFSFSVLSFCRTDQEFLQWPSSFFFFLDDVCMFAKDLTGCFSHCCVKVVIIESMSVPSLLMMVRGANFPPIIAWKVSNTLGSFSFSKSNLSLVCFGSLIVFRRRCHKACVHSERSPYRAVHCFQCTKHLPPSPRLS